MSDGKTYPDFLDDMGKLLQAAMPRTDRERDELYAAEAEVRRLRSQLAVAEERRELAQTRYDRERAVLREMFETWKAEVMSLPDEGTDKDVIVERLDRPGNRADGVRGPLDDHSSSSTREARQEIVK